MSIEMSTNFFRLLKNFRGHDLVGFEREHRSLYETAKETGDYTEVTAHYYSLMSAVIESYFGGNFHFVAPLRRDDTLEEALRELHLHMSESLELAPGVHCLDIGCGVGGVMRDVATSGCRLTGVTISPDEVPLANKHLARSGFASTCDVVCGDARKLPQTDGSMDAAYAVYALKYLPELDKTMAEVARVLKAGGRFLVYDLLTTDRYDKENPQHRSIIEGLEYACGMPTLHSRDEMILAAQRAGLVLEKSEDISANRNRPFYYCFSHSRLFMFLIRNSLVQRLIGLGVGLHFLPRGFKKFNATFLAGTVEKIVHGGELGILSGSDMLLFRKPAVEQ